MAGTTKGGKIAAKTNKKRYGKDFYAIQGAKGGRAGNTGGFYHMKATGQIDKVREAGRRGGSISRRGSRAVY